MMKHAYRTMLLALLAIFALSAITAAAASAAAPEFKPVPTKKKFTGTSGALEFNGSSIYTCTSSTTAGEITGAATIGKVVIKYVGCKETWPGSCPIKSEGAKEGEIVTKALKGQLGTVATKEAASGVGVLLSAEVGPGSAWAKIEATCRSSTKLQGEDVAEITPVGTKGTSLSFVFATLPEGEKIKEITIGGTKRKVLGLEAYSEPWNQSMSDALKFEESLEVT